jgi:Fe-S cluster biogenesis protein NfuA
MDRITSATNAIEPLVSALRADGGDLRVTAAGAEEVQLDLIVADANCAECIMPRPALEAMARTALAKTYGDVTVVVSDPRDGAAR